MGSLSLPPDPYKVLGVSKDAQIPEIRSAHRKLVLKCHPDKVQDPTLKAEKQDEFQKVQQAYELLSDDKERSKYDDQVKLAELRKQKANSSSTRTVPKYAEFEIRTAEPRPTTFKSSPSSGKTYSYSRSYEDDYGYDVRYADTESRSRRMPSNYAAEKPSKREMEREREFRDRETEKMRERRRKEAKEAKEAEESRRQEKAAKEARKLKEKAKDKERKRQADDKRKARPYVVDSYDEDVTPSRSEKKKSSSSSKKYDEKRERERGRERERSMPRDESPAAMPSAVPFERERSDREKKEHYDTHRAASYIYASRMGATGAQRSTAYYPPAVPTPPPVAGQSSPYAVPDDDEAVHRSRANVRRGSSDTIRSAREKTYKKSNERLDDGPIIRDATPPGTRHGSSFHKSSSSVPRVSESPSPRSRELPRRETMPVEPTYTRSSVPPITRSQTFTTGTTSGNRGRSRSRWESQIAEETDSDDPEEYAARRRERSRKQRASEEPPTKVRYQVNDGRTQKLYNSYSRRMEPEHESFSYYPQAAGVRVVDAPPMPSREHSGYRARGFKVKETPSYGYEDVQYSNSYGNYPAYREGTTVHG